MVAEFLDDVFCEMLLDFTMARNRLGHSRIWVAIPDIIFIVA